MYSLDLVDLRRGRRDAAASAVGFLERFLFKGRTHGRLFFILKKSCRAVGRLATAFLVLVDICLTH